MLFKRTQSKQETEMCKPKLVKMSHSTFSHLLLIETKQPGRS
jgi:hypothetical protein